MKHNGYTNPDGSLKFSLEERFWSHVTINEVTGCWEWNGASATSEYGHIRLGSKELHAHRVAYEMLVGPIPRGLFVCHHCDNKACVRSDHLFCGTRADNMNDMFGKGRGKVKLSPPQVRQIRKMYANNAGTQKEISGRFGVSESLVRQIVNHSRRKGIA